MIVFVCLECTKFIRLQVIIDNGILQLTLSKPDGIVTGVQYNGVDNLMEVINKEDDRGYSTCLALFDVYVDQVSRSTLMIRCLFMIQVCDNKLLVVFFKRKTVRRERSPGVPLISYKLLSTCRYKFNIFFTN